LTGLGDLGAHILDMLSRVPHIKIILASRNKQYLHQRSNLTRFTAAQFESYPDITYDEVDLSNVEQTASVIAKHQPDIILNTATLQSWRVLTFLPKSVFEELDTAQFGPWLPMHLPLMHKLMLAVKQT